MAGRYKLRDSGGRFQNESDWFKVEADGPFFDGTGPAMLREAERQMSNKAAKAVQRHVSTIGKRNFRYEYAPATYFFENHVEVDRVADGHLVHANQVVYGNWLEGTSSRNQTSRFKGYHLFRTATQEVQRRLPDILTDDEMRLAQALNGTGVRSGPTL
jgi:hypothetical protein